MNDDKTSAKEIGNQAILDLKDILDAKFDAGEGVVVISATMTDAELVDVMRAALSHGVPFKVMPGKKITHIVMDEWHQSMPPLPR